MIRPVTLERLTQPREQQIRDKVAYALESMGYIRILHNGQAVGARHCLDRRRKIMITGVNCTTGMVNLEAISFTDESPARCAVSAAAPKTAIGLAIEDLTERMVASYADSAYRVIADEQTIREGIERAAIDALDDTYPADPEEFQPVDLAIDVTEWSAEFYPGDEDAEHTIRIGGRWMVAKHWRTEQIEGLMISTYYVEIPE